MFLFRIECSASSISVLNFSHDSYAFMRRRNLWIPRRFCPAVSLLKGFPFRSSSDGLAIF